VLNVIEFVCDRCNQCETITNMALAADAEAHLANIGWLVSYAGGPRMIHVCPRCRREDAAGVSKLLSGGSER
jgi:hypothetical protein